MKTQIDEDKKFISFDTARKCLALIWYTGAGVLFIIMFLQSMFGHYGDSTQEAWSWLLPNLMPTLSLITSVIVVNAFHTHQSTIKVDRFLLYISLYSSLIYIIVLNLTVFLSPFSTIHPLDLMRLSNIWLGPFQGLVSITIGLFFITKDEC